ncbi:hypothetical protein [Halodesulfovibrio marinisediminis]|uniref:Uncharacterized protein n=1 Tax=Halodesulfovibrio marinisediminis DSM 17456 TaxID=1121457 RepID=A0A1N6E9K5_9BACT|nr:hypothetical protein [Halodesulfovibrio marinisediminis]SIN79682.1 hypothetical protein SAMN02745161_0812 [Halodesulfovibrio marinisediminis DSM 17456]
MKFRSVVTLIVFVLFVGLCGYELANNVTNSFQRDTASVRYVRSLESPKKEDVKKPTFDLDKILEETDVNG